MKYFFGAFFLFFSIILSAGPTVTDNHIKVDQFGYRPNDVKIAVISNPQTGYNNGSPFTPGSMSYTVKRWSDNVTVFTGMLTAWNSGVTHAQSGDKAWWFDFSTVTTPGSYYVYDSVKQVGSYRFEISDCAYNDVLKHAVRTFYYQRCGTPKLAANAGTGWADASCHTGTQQDTDCRLHNNTNASTSKNLSGGWHDAGDYNKYVNFAFAPTIDLLLAYEENPNLWKDDYNLPESGNSVPDLLDEIKFELDWLLKMQQSDGSVLCVIGGGSGSPPSADTQARRYGPATTAASLTSSALFALGAIQFKALGNTTYASTLQSAAESAWTWANANTNVTFNNAGVIAAGEQEVDDYGRLSRKIAAACFLYALTNNSTYKTFFENNYAQIHLKAWSYAYPFEGTQQDVLLYYTKLSGISTTVKNDILNTYSNSMKTGNGDNLPAFTNKTDAYRAFLSDGNFTWGSNQTKCRQGSMFTNMNQYALDGTNATNYTAAALGFINYIHGVNPTAFAYLSNMGGYGAENSINEFYHSWFTDGSSKWDRTGTSTYGPAPAFVPGGPNPGWKLDGCCPSGCGSSQNNALCVTLQPPGSQPIQKSYRDWNTNWPQNSWEVTENGIYYQSAYIRLLSKFSSASPCSTTAVHSTPVNFSVSIYPNPASEYMEIHVPSAGQTPAKIELIDITGSLIFSITATSSSATINTSHLSQGIYFISIQSGNFIRKAKISVVR